MAVTGPVVVAADTGLGEGPVWCPDGTLVITSVDRGLLYRTWPGSGQMEVIADTGGAPNAAQLASDGGFVVTQAGGFDLSAFSPAHPRRPPGVPVLYQPPATPRPVRPGLQRVTPDGRVHYLADEGFLAPNDLTVTADGTVYFTDPPPLARAEDRARLIGRVWSYRAGTLSMVADGFAYCNGIAAGRYGSLVVVEGLGLQRLGLDGSREPIIEKVSEGAADGVCLDVDGRIYAAANPDRAVKVIEEGRVVECLTVPGGDLGVLTNCCFGGPDGRTLFVNDAFHGRVLAWESMPSPGLPLHPWPVPPT